ncbi:hypothetical protein Tco_1107205 [Tanacetum coccineum]
MHEDFIATVCPKVYESLKHPTKEHVFLENPPSSSGTLSSMKNLDDAFTFGDQFIDDNPNKEETDKANVESKIESMVTVPIHQASSSAPTLSTPIIELTTPKPFESGPYRSQPEHAALYDALEASMDRENREEFIEATTKSRKRRRDDQDPPSPPPKDSDQSKKKRHDSDASASKQPQAQTSSA